MTDAVTEPADATITSFSAPPPETEDPARQVGEIFRRLSGCHTTYGEKAFVRIVAAVLVALGRAAMEEAEAQALRLRERSAPARAGIRVAATARRVDFDAWDPGDPD